MTATTRLAGEESRVPAPAGPKQQTTLIRGRAVMRFDSGLLGHNGDVSRYPPIDEWTETLQILETSGYGGVWSAEHHFFWDGWTNPVPTNPVLFCSYAAGRTTRLKLGQCGVCLPDHHPLRVAEDVAMIDQMSHGRVEFGVIRGLNNRVNGNFHPQADRRDQKVNQALFWECLDIIELAWKGEPFRFEGQFYQFPMPGWRDEKTPEDELDSRYYTADRELTHLKVMPETYQKPMPPRWLMADTVGSHVAAARRGMGAMSYAQSIGQTKATWDAYRAARPNDTPADRPELLSAMRPIFVAETQQAAEAVMRPAINLNMQRGVRASSDLEMARRSFLAADEALEPRDLTDDWFDFLVRKEHCHVGTPDYVTDRLRKFAGDVKCDHMVLFWALPLITFEQYRDCLNLFAEKVMPEF
jgi:alkanesulfonate monooxygenase SsuD/methylene tetrahydromethanopterin reductase-like flavin-dependent oxidoreductase (luciferase family)